MNSILFSSSLFLNKYGSTSLLSLIILSSVFGIFAAWLYGLTTNQKLIKKSKDGIQTAILEGAIFLDSPKALLKSQGALLFQALKYLSVSLTGLIALIIPVAFVLSFGAPLFEYKPLSDHSSVLVEVETKASKDLFKLSVQSPSGITVSPFVRDIPEKKAYMRLNVESCTNAPLMVVIGAERTLIPLKCQHDRFVQPTAFENGAASFLFPGTLTDSDSSLHSVRVDYPTATGMHWLITFSIVSLIAGFCGAKLFKIQL